MRGENNLLILFCKPYPGMPFAYPQAATSASQLQPVGQMYPAPYQGMFGKYMLYGSFKYLQQAVL